MGICERRGVEQRRIFQFVTRPLAKALVSCDTGRSEDMFEGAVALSDHLLVVAEFG